MFTNALPIYSEKIIKMDEGRHLELVISDSLVLETLLCQLKGEIIKFSQKLVRSERELEDNLERATLLLQENMDT